MHETALRVHLAAHGASHADDRGVLLPRHFGDPAAEYGALTRAAALVDLGFRELVRATGSDRAAFLQGMLTNDVAALPPGAGCGALLLTIQGRVVADVRVAALDAAMLLDVDVRARDAFVEALEKLLVADDVELGAPAIPTTLVGLEGPEAARCLGGAAPEAPWAHVELDVGGVRIRAMRASEVGAVGYVLHVPVSGAVRVWDALAAKAAQPCGMEALERRRIEVGVPRIGVDMDGATLALEVPVDDRLSATKGCYLGQEVVARGTARGHVNRRLVGLVLEGPLPPAGATLVRDGKEAGRLTSVAGPLAGRQAVALGFVRREAWEPGTELRVAHGHAVTVARVAGFPIPG